MRRRMIWTVVWTMVIALIAAGTLLPAAPNLASSTDAAKRLNESSNGAGMGMGNLDAQGMMMLINRSVSVNAR